MIQYLLAVLIFRCIYSNVGEVADVPPYSIEQFYDLLQMSRISTTAAIVNIEKQWEIEKYPKFLNSCQMQNSSWYELKLRFMKIIVAAEMLKHSVIGYNLTEVTNEFIISFTGSAVTAGHDVHISNAYPYYMRQLMNDDFAKLNIYLHVRNVAQGNTLCFPYDPCVRTMAGDDADMVLWEHTNACIDLPVYEQFARQLLLLKKRPLLVYSESQTSHWYSNYIIRHRSMIL